jgi:hypothetical protein
LKIRSGLPRVTKALRPRGSLEAVTIQGRTTMRNRGLTTVLAASAAGGALALAGCGGASPSGHSASQVAASVSAAASQAASSSQGSSSSAKINVCADLPASTASQITGTKLTSAKASNVEGVIFECEYKGPKFALLQVNVDIGNGLGDYSEDISALSTVGHKPDSVSGAGDKAYSMPDPNGNAGSAGAAAFSSFGALFGTTYIKIGGLTYVTANQGTKIANEIHSKM